MTCGEAMSFHEDWYHLRKVGMKDWIKRDERDVKSYCSLDLKSYQEIYDHDSFH